MEASKVLIYLDEGVDPHSFRLLVKALRAEDRRLMIQSINREHFLLPDWEQSTQLVIFPGGRDIPYNGALKGERNKRLRRYVENGGRYLGICAGAYYGAASIVFEEGGPLEVKGDRELGFYAGVAKGPIYGHGQFCYSSLKGARLAQVAWPGGISYSYFNGGCSFVGANATVLATYHDLAGELPAAISCCVGKGKALLCGVHPEYDKEAIPNHLLTNAYDETSRKAFWQHLLEAALAS